MKAASPARSRSSSPVAIRPAIPEPQSINSILRQHCRSRLYVQPLHWTCNHLQLLNCRFALKVLQNKRLKPHQGPAPAGDTQSRLVDNVTYNGKQHQGTRPTQVAICAAEDLFYRANNTVLKHLAVEELLSIYNIRPLDLGSHCLLPFHFGQRAVAHLKISRIFSHPSFSSTSPYLAYLDLGSMPEFRDNSINMVRNNRRNFPVACIEWQKRRRLQPPVEMEDPYIVAILIALAQEQRQANKQQETGAVTIEKATTTFLPSPPETSKGRPRETASVFKVRLLATADTDTRHLYFYKACIPVEFLDKFDMPSRFSPSSPLVVSYYRIPLSPITKLTRQLKSLLSTWSRRRAEPGLGGSIGAGAPITSNRDEAERRDGEVADWERNIPYQKSES